MKIAIVSEGFFPEVNGVNYSVYYHTKFLLAHNHEVLLVIPKYPEEIARSYDEAFLRLKDDVADDVTVLEFHSVPLTSERPVVRIPSFVGHQQINEAMASFSPALCIYHNPDRLMPHCNIPFLPSVISGLVVCKRLGVEVVPLIHTMMPEYIDSATEWWLKPRIIRETLKNTWTNCHNKNFETVYTVSKKAHVKLNRFGITTKIVSGSFNGVDLEIFQNQDTLPRERRGDLKITWVGRLTPEKNAHLLSPFVRALKKRMKNFHLTIIGNGPLKKAVSEDFKDDGSVHLTGYLSQGEISSHLKRSDIYLTLSTTESGCLTIREALATGTPIIAPKSNSISYSNKPIGLFFDESLLDITKLGELADTVTKDMDQLALWEENIEEIIPQLDWNYTIAELMRSIESNTGLTLLPPTES